MIFPQFRQLGAVANSGCIVALQSQCLLSEDNLGFVASSRVAIADVRSAILEVVVVVPFRDVEDPGCACVVDFLDCFDLTLGMKSDIRLPAAEGGNFGAAGEASLELAEDPPP